MAAEGGGDTSDSPSAEIDAAVRGAIDWYKSPNGVQQDTRYVSRSSDSTDDNFEHRTLRGSPCPLSDEGTYSLQNVTAAHNAHDFPLIDYRNPANSVRYEEVGDGMNVGVQTDAADIATH